MTPYGQADTQYAQPLHTSGCTITVPNSVRTRAPVGQTSRQPACVQLLQTSDDISHLVVPPSAISEISGESRPLGSGVPPGSAVAPWAGRVCSTKATCRQLFEPRAPVLS